MALNVKISYNVEKKSLTIVVLIIDLKYYEKNSYEPIKR
jgi:hypothetical protein|nr:MAG TPA: hypothetical protein [Caudoviricetes sp.]